ncbi:MAG: hypothetical protein KDN22_02595 [Verrucomicrobiae bacterium]|nr:hypothetical protein [Verrucomicrobiae bacterium]
MKRALLLGGIIVLVGAVNFVLRESEKALLAEQSTKLNFPKPTAAALAERTMILPEIDIHDEDALIRRLATLRGLISSGRRSKEFAKLCDQLITDNPLAHLKTVRSFDGPHDCFHQNYVLHWSRTDPIGITQYLDDIYPYRAETIDNAKSHLLADRNFDGLLHLADNRLRDHEAREIREQVFRELYTSGEIERALEIRQRYGIGEYAFLASAIFAKQGAADAVRWVEKQAQGHPRTDALDGLFLDDQGGYRPLAQLLEIVNFASDENLIRQIGGRIGVSMTNFENTISDNLESVQQLENISETARQAAKSGILVRLVESNPEGVARTLSLDDFGSVDRWLLLSTASAYATADLEGALEWAMSYPKENREEALASVISELASRTPERVPSVIAKLGGRTRNYCIMAWVEHLKGQGNSEEAIAWEKQMTERIELPRWTLTVE